MGVVSGRFAAQALFNVYEDFWDRSFKLSAFDSFNAERFVKKVAERHGLHLIPLSHAMMPFGDAVYLGNSTQYCFIAAYWCGTPKELEKSHSTLCPDKRRRRRRKR